MILNNLQFIVVALVVLVLFYFINYVISTLTAKLFLNREDGISLVNGTVLRNLSLAVGLAATSFGAEAALIVTRFHCSTTKHCLLCPAQQQVLA